MESRVQDVVRKLHEIAKEHPDAEVKIDPPYSDVYSIDYREEDDVVTINH